MSGLRSATRHTLTALAAGILLMLSAPLVTSATQPPGAEPLLAPIGLVRKQPANGPSRVQLTIEQLNPRVVRADTLSVTVSGRLTNVGDRRIDQVELRLQRGEALTDEAKLRAAMAQAPAAETARSDFAKVTPALEQGASAPFSIEVPVAKLKLDQPGVYPILINVNGRPEYGNGERVAGLTFLLPVLSAPGKGVPQPPNPAKITLLWPIVDDHPRVVSEGQGRPTVLSDDDLASSLQVGGRLYGMLKAVEIASKQNPQLASSICYAIDGDLLATAQAMSNGYQVQGQNGQTVPGKGKDFAKRWLDQLRTLTAGQCVFPLPYADADLSALSHAGAANLAKNAVSQSLAVVSSVLQPLQPQKGLLWPIGGTLDQRTLGDITDSPTTILINPGKLKAVSGAAPYAIGQDRAVPIDQLVSSSLTGPNGPVSVQNGLATLVFRAMQTGQNVLVAPPRRWTAPASELTVYLQSIGRMFADKLAAPQVLPELTGVANGGTATALDYSGEDTAAEVSGQVLAEITQSNNIQRDLQGAMQADDTKPVNPDDLMKPIRSGLLRAASSAWRGNQDGGLRASAAATGLLDAMRGQVTVSPPGPPITLASSNSPIPIRIGNSLPVMIKVRLVLSENSGLRPNAIPELTIPAGITLTNFVPTDQLRAGKFWVDVWVTTPGGTTLGTTSRLELSSTSYGTITVTVTSVAGGMLVLLAARRVYRRIKDKQNQEPTPA